MSKNDFYVTTYCNFAHRIKDGKPINHECMVIPKQALKIEMDGGSVQDFWDEVNRHPKVIMRRGVKE